MQRKRKYTEAIHAQRVKKVIEKKEPNKHCPASRKFGTDSVYHIWAAPYDDEVPEAKKPCHICTGFLGLSHYTPAGRRCPCVRLGTKRAVELTWQKLEQKGYL